MTNWKEMYEKEKEEKKKVEKENDRLDSAAFIFLLVGLVIGFAITGTIAIPTIWGLEEKLEKIGNKTCNIGGQELEEIVWKEQEPTIHCKIGSPQKEEVWIIEGFIKAQDTTHKNAWAE